MAKITVGNDVSESARPGCLTACVSAAPSASASGSAPILRRCVSWSASANSPFAHRGTTRSGTHPPSAPSQARHRARDGPRVGEGVFDRDASRASCVFFVVRRGVSSSPDASAAQSKSSRAGERDGRLFPRRRRAPSPRARSPNRHRTRHASNSFGGDGPAEEHPDARGGPEKLTHARARKSSSVTAAHATFPRASAARERPSRAVRARRAAAAVARGPVGRGAHVQRHLRGDAGEAATLEPAVSEQPALQEHQVARAVARDSANHVVEVPGVRGDEDGAAPSKDAIRRVARPGCRTPRDAHTALSPSRHDPRRRRW